MIDRRSLMLAVMAVGLAPRFAMGATMSRVTAYAFTFPALDGSSILLSSYAGRPLLVVNTASHCGYTPQYTGLQTLWSRYRDRGLMVIGVPSNDFGGQEPGGATEIGKTAQGEYHVTFPLAAKIAVKGSNAHPFYRWAAQERPQEAPRWNFHKYLIGRDGNLRGSYVSAMDPTDPRIISAIEQEVAGA